MEWKIIMLVITPEIASDIIENIAGLTDYEIAIINHEGVIVSRGGNAAGMSQPDALTAMAGGKAIIRGNSEADAVPGARPGITLPIELHGNCVGAVSITGNPNDLRHFAYIVKFSVESLLEKMLLKKQGVYERKLLESWVLNLFEEEFPNFEELHSVAKSLNINTSATCVVFVIHFFSEQNKLSSNVLQNLAFDENYILQFISGYAKVNFGAYLGKGMYAVCVETNSGKYRHRREPSNIDTMLMKLHDELMSMKIHNYIGIGSEASDLPGYRNSYQQSVQSSKMMLRTGIDKPLMHIYDWNILYFISQMPEHAANSLVKQYLGGKPPFEGELIDTMEAYFQNNCAVQQTSDSIYMHKNTLLYKLQKVKEIYGLDPRNFHDAIILQLLIYIRKFYPDIE